MLRLKEFNDSKIGFPSLLNYFGLVDDGIILNKDGSLLCGFKYRGKDIESMTNNERDKLSLHVNNVLKQLNTGWVLNANAIRISASEYISSDYFPDYISKMVEQERKEFYNQSDEHFENLYFFTLTYKEKLLDSKKISKFFFTQEVNTTQSMDNILIKFKEISLSIKEGLSSVLNINKMNSSELLNHLMLCIHGRNIPLNIDGNYGFLNHKLGSYDFVGGHSPKIDDSYIGIIAIDGFPMTTFSNMLDVYYSNINGFQGTALTIASNLFTILAGIQISMSIILWILNRDDPDSLIINLAKKIFFLSFFWMIIDHYDDWVPIIYKSFTTAGSQISGNSNLSPTNVYDTGSELYTRILNASKSDNIFPSIGGSLLSILLGGIVWFCFLRIAMKMVVVMVGGKIILTGGIVLLGFSGSKWTMSFEGNMHKF